MNERKEMIKELIGGDGGRHVVKRLLNLHALLLINNYIYILKTVGSWLVGYGRFCPWKFKLQTQAPTVTVNYIIILNILRYYYLRT